MVNGEIFEVYPGSQIPYFRYDLTGFHHSPFTIHPSPALKFFWQFIQFLRGQAFKIIIGNF
jgi:hypothetical protein